MYKNLPDQINKITTNILASRHSTACFLIKKPVYHTQNFILDKKFNNLSIHLKQVLLTNSNLNLFKRSTLIRFRAELSNGFYQDPYVKNLKNLKDKSSLKKNIFKNLVKFSSSIDFKDSSIVKKSCLNKLKTNLPLAISKLNSSSNCTIEKSSLINSSNKKLTINLSSKRVKIKSIKKIKKTTDL
jgi:hypothetical protein